MQKQCEKHVLLSNMCIAHEAIIEIRRQFRTRAPHILTIKPIISYISCELSSLNHRVFLCLHYHSANMTMVLKAGIYGIPNRGLIFIGYNPQANLKSYCICMNSYL